MQQKLTRKPLRAKVALKKRVALASKSNLKAKQPLPKKPKAHTVAWYKKEARTWFNRAVKYRDSELLDGAWVFTCITCPRRVLFRDAEGRFYRPAQAGHFQPETRANTRFNELNVNGQCSRCNYDGLGEQVKYARALDLKYGAGTATELERLAHLEHQFTIEELQEIIHDSKEQVKFYERLA